MRVPVGADVSGRLVRRYKRFLADVETDAGELITVHCPNPGSMLGLQTPGSAVRCSTSANPKRKLRHTLEMIRVGRAWVGLHTLRANQLAAKALAQGAVEGLTGFGGVRAEVTDGEGSRIDFRLEDGPHGESAWVEVKSVTLAEGSTGRFPDAVTARGRKHMDTLARLRTNGARSVVLFVVQRGDCDRVEPADDIDPAYGEALRAAVKQGVEVLAVRARVSPAALTLDGMLPVHL